MALPHFTAVRVEETTWFRSDDGPNRSMKATAQFLNQCMPPPPYIVGGGRAVIQPKVPPCEACFALWGHAVDRAVASTSRSTGLRYIYESQEGPTMLILRKVTQGKPPG